MNERQANTIDRRRPRAFTLIELLVVVAVIALLIAILLPSLKRAKDRAKRVVCASRMHQMSIAVTGYQAENRGVYPTAVDPFKWPVGGSAPVGDPLNPSGYAPAGAALLYLAGYMQDPTFFYCPSATYEGWDYNVFVYQVQEQTWEPSLWRSESDSHGAGYPIVGYVYWAGYRVDWDRHPDPDYDPERVAHPRRPEPDQVVWSDVIARHPQAVGSWLGDWHNVNHLDRDGKPEGGHELLVDGSATWIDFDPQKTKRRLRLGIPSITLEFHFVGPVRPGDEDITP